MALNSQIGTIGDPAPAVGSFPPNHKFYSKDFIKTAEVAKVYDMFGEPAPIALNSSNTAVYNKVDILPTLQNSPLIEGVTPVEQQTSMTRIEKPINQYGGFVRTTDRLQTESINGVMMEINRTVARQAGETMNLVSRDDLEGGTNVRFAGGVATRDAITAAGLPASDYAFMYQAFKLARAKAKTRMTGGSQNIGTSAQKAQFVEVLPVEAQSLIEALDDGNGKKFVGAEDYMTQRNLWPDEEGSFKQFAFITNTEASIAVNAAATAQNIAVGLVFGQGAFKVLSLGGKGVELFTKGLGVGGDDPLNQRASHGWKDMGGSMITQETYMFRHEFSIGDN